MKKKGKCVHYNGTVNDCCDAGVNYQSLTDGKPGWGNKLPCGLRAVVEAEKVTCEKFQEPTDAEIAEDEAAMKESHRKMMLTLPLVSAMKARHLNGKKFRSGEEKITCPACGTGELHMAISGYNGHTQGRCSTQGCVAWIE